MTGLVSVAHTKKGVTSITLELSEAVEQSSATEVALYALDAGVKKHKKTVYTKKVAIKSVSYQSGATTLTIYLKKPYKGVLQATVKPELVGADGLASTTPYMVVT